MPEQESQSVLARRQFIKSIIAGGAVAASASYLFREPSWAAPAAGSVERLVTLNVNGQLRRVDVLKQESLAMTLRYKLGLTGTKLTSKKTASARFVRFRPENVIRSDRTSRTRRMGSWIDRRIDAWR
jgi:hypothetical protein